MNVSVERLYRSFSDPLQLAKWWGPEGFSNTIHEFDLKPGGNWILTMHGPDKGNYENSSVFKEIIEFELVSWTRKSQPLFDMEIGFKKIDAQQAEISFRMIFPSEETCNHMRNFVVPKNEENFDRLERLLGAN